MITTISGSPAADMIVNAFQLRLVEDAAEEDERRQAAGDEEQRREQRHEQQDLRLMDQRMEVEVDAALDEEDRDQETEPDGLELARDLLGVLTLDEEADDDARRRRRRAGRRGSASAAGTRGG